MATAAPSPFRTPELRALVADMVRDDRENGVFRVNRKAFIDQTIFELEREAIFNHSWLYLGHVSEVPKPTSFITRKVGGRTIIMNRDRNGQVNAFYNTCSHRGAVLCREKQGRRGSFACPYHGWLYDDQGSLIKIPGRECYSPAILNDDTLGLTRLERIAEFCGFVFICFDPDVEDIETYLAGAKEILENITSQGEHGMEICTGAQEYCTPANWKLMFENSGDGYHAAPTHMSYFDYISARDADFLANQGGGRETLVGVPSINLGIKSLGNGHSVIQTEGVWGRPAARWVPGWGEEARAEIDETKRRIHERFGAERGMQITDIDRNTLMFPNFVVNDLMAITVRTFYPITPSYMEINAWALAPIGENPKSRERRLQNFVEFFGPAGFASPDDVEMLDLCQQGYANQQAVGWNDISKGMLRETQAADDEEQMRDFWRKWSEMMTKAVA